MTRRVAFAAVGGAGWLGGQNYLRNLIWVLRLYGTPRLEPVVFAGTDAAGTSLQSVCVGVGIECITSADFDGDRLRRRAFATILRGRDMISQAHFQAARADAVFEAGSYLGWRSAVPIISWYPDFQHKHLPAMFQASDRFRRDLLLRARMAGPRQFMLSSRAAEADCLRFFPAAAGRTIAVPFAVLPTGGPDEDGAAILAKYTIGGSYVFLPNQFWRHKNHTVVIEALRLLKQRGCPVQVVASGLQCDMRDPSHFPALETLISDAGIGDNFRMLGVIPYTDLTLLMGNAAAVLNPSLFEGWSTTVEESRAMGVPMLLSDIPVHREQMAEGADYFPPHDAEALAALLSRFPPNQPLPDDASRRNRARAGQRERMHAFADRFLEATERAIAGHRS